MENNLLELLWLQVSAKALNLECLPSHWWGDLNLNDTSPKAFFYISYAKNDTYWELIFIN